MGCLPLELDELKLQATSLRAQRNDHAPTPYDPVTVRSDERRGGVLTPTGPIH
jgi:hypothetical protein